MLTPPFDPAKPDLCIVGAGTAGHALALAAAALGLRCTVVDPRAHLGGGQAADLLEAVVVADMAAAIVRGHAATWEALARRAALALARAAPDHAGARLRTLGVALVTAAARFSDGRTLQAGSLTVRARRFVLATGAEGVGTGSALAGLAMPEPLTPGQLLRSGLPRRIAVLAERSCGVEWAQVLARHGVAVSLVVAPSVLSAFDSEALAFATAGLRRDGVALDVGGASKFAAAAREHLACLPFPVTMPRTAGLELDRAGITLDQHGAPVVDRGLRTTNPRIFALGDVLGGAPNFDGDLADGLRAVLRSVASGLPSGPGASPAARVLRTVPPVAQVGTLVAARLWRAPAPAGSPAGPGLAKFATDGRGRVAGAAVAGPGASEAIAVAALAVARRLPAATLATVGGGGAAEALRRAAQTAVLERARHPALRRLIALAQRLP